MSSSPPIKGILFDMDDTLLDWSDFDGNWGAIEYAHLVRVYEHAKVNDCALDGTLQHFVNEYRENVMEAWANGRDTLRAPHVGKILIETMMGFGFMPTDACNEQSCLDAYGWQGIPNAKVFPDVPSGLAKLQEQGVALGIVTNAGQPMWMRYAELERTNLKQYFPNNDVLISAADVGYLKPHRRIFEVGLERLGTTAAETLYIGDNPVADIAGAQGAGLRAVLRVNRPSPPLISGLIVPDAAINSFDELLLLVDDWDTHATSE